MKRKEGRKGGEIGEREREIGIRCGTEEERKINGQQCHDEETFSNKRVQVVFRAHIGQFFH